jgi:plastocyanin
MEPTQPIVSVVDPKASGVSRHKGVIIAVAAALLFLAGGSYYIYRSGDADTSALSPGIISVTDNGFVPGTIRVKKGQQVSWRNTDSKSHQVVSEDVGALQLGQSTVLTQDDTTTVFFEKTGTYQYHDNLTTPGFQGTVIVE